jgi:hypothetical protein
MAIVFLLVNSSLLNLGSAKASAGYYPTNLGDKIQVEFCLPASAKSPVYLQLMEVNKTQGRTVATIHFSHLLATSGCRELLKHGINMGNNGPYDLVYNWKVNVTGGNALQLYVPNLGKAIYGFPDGIQVGKK